MEWKPAFKQITIEEFVSTMPDFRYPTHWSIPMPHHTDRPETRHQKIDARKLVREYEILADDDVEEATNVAHVDGFHEVMVVSHQHHLDNIEASDALLKLLNFHHGRDRGYSDGYGNI